MSTARLDAFVAGPAELLATGFEFTEGPAWNARTGELLFSDIPGNAIRSWDAERATDWRRPSNMANGLAYDREGRLLACESATSRITRTEADGATSTVASHHGEHELNSPNDLVVRSDGSIYFTDPAGGRSRPHGVERPRELDFQGVYRVAPGGGEPVLEVDDFHTPNGLCFSPDETLLYVNDSIRMHIRIFGVANDGSLDNGRVFFVQEGYTPDIARVVEHLTRTGRLEHGLPDGMKADEHGNVYCTGHGGIWVIAPDGEFLGLIETPEIPANLAWGGADGYTLFICATTSLYGVPMHARGAAAGSP